MQTIVLTWAGLVLLLWLFTYVPSIPSQAIITPISDVSACVGRWVVVLYLDGDASVDAGHVDAVRLSVGQVALVHVYCKWPLQSS